MRVPPQIMLLLLLATSPGALLYAQATPLGATPGPVGAGPRTDVQIGPNATLEVGGARGADVNMTGENFRGNYGASRPQASSIPGPASTSPTAPAAHPPAFYAPSFKPNASKAAGSPDLNGSAADRRAEISHLLLPRFRAKANGAASPADLGDGWRYKYSRGRWWYWAPSESWLYWDGADWRAFSPRR